jgi:hypothetical protein
MASRKLKKPPKTSFADLLPAMRKDPLLSRFPDSALLEAFNACAEAKEYASKDPKAFVMEATAMLDDEWTRTHAIIMLIDADAVDADLAPAMPKLKELFPALTGRIRDIAATAIIHHHLRNDEPGPVMEFLSSEVPSIAKAAVECIALHLMRGGDVSSFVPTMILLTNHADQGVASTASLTVQGMATHTNDPRALSYINLDKEIAEC